MSSRQKTELGQGIKGLGSFGRETLRRVGGFCPIPLGRGHVERRDQAIKRVLPNDSNYTRSISAG